VPVTRRDALYTALGSEEEGTRRAQEKVSPMCQSGDLETIHLINLGMELILGLEVETSSCSDCEHHCKVSCSIVTMPPPNKKSKRADVETKVSPKGSSDAHVQRPAWPHMQLERPNDMLSLHHLMPAQIVTISNFWSAALCRRYVTFLSSLPLVTTPGVPKKGDAVRVNDRFQVDDPVFASLLWNSTGLKDLVLDEDTEQGGDKFWGGEVLGLNSNIRIYRYRKGQFFDQHCEWSLCTL